MDIRKWLDETVRPDVPDKPELPSVKPVVRPGKSAPVFKGRQRRKRSKSDSSLLDPPPRREETSTDKRRPPTERSLDHSAESGTSYTTHSDSSKSNTSSQRYARKPRRKTRLERYKPSSKAKERGKHAHQSRQGESKKSRRKSKRKKGEKQGSGIVQSFHAKNVSGDRLTLKPRELGIFNKGKTSTAVKGRGLPDLVFSEMKFLRKHKEQPELTLQPDVPKKKRKKDHIHSKEGEISAFFSSVRPALAEKDGNSLTMKTRQRNDTLPELSRQELSPVVDAAIPTVEMSDKASYLGFGSRGARHESTSYVSWSESVQAPSTTPAPPRTNPTIYASQFDSLNRRENRAVADKEDTSFKRPALPSLTRQRTHGTAERFGVSSIAPSHHRLSRSHSYPKHTSSPRRPNLVDRAAKFQTTDTAGSPSSMPPFAPVCESVAAQEVHVTDSPEDSRCRATSLSNRNNLSPDRQPLLRAEKRHADIHPQTSSDFGRVLQLCNSTIHERRQAATPRRRHTLRIDPTYPTIQTEPQRTKNLDPTISRVPTVRFVGVESHAPTLPNFAAPSIYEQQAQRQQLPLQPIVDEDVFNDLYAMDGDCLDENDEMDYVDQNWDEIAEEPMLNGLSGEYGTYDVEEDSALENVTQRLVSDSNVVAPGFWRPNRLY